MICEINTFNFCFCFTCESLEEQRKNELDINYLIKYASLTVHIYIYINTYLVIIYIYLFLRKKILYNLYQD